MDRIYTIGDEILKKKAEEVFIIDERVKKIVDEMLKLMYDSSGIGLAANQVGIPERIFVADAEYPSTKKRNPVVFINPRITDRKGSWTCEEGCLSVPGVYLSVKRPKAVTVTAKNREGREFSLRADGMLARVIQHENDHLDGILMTDRASRWERFKKRALLKKLKK